MEKTLCLLFSWGGVAAVLYEEILGKKHFKKYRKRGEILNYLLFPLCIFLSLLIGIHAFNINPYYASYFGFLISAAVMWFYRKDLFWHSVISGLFLSIFYFVLFAFIFVPLFPGIIQKWWHLSKLSGVLFLGVPLEEVLWSFFFGLLVGPSYEFLLGLKDKKFR